jgi:hypothetical protein
LASARFTVGGSHTVIVLSDEKLDLSLMNMLGLVKCTYRTYSMLLKIIPCVLYVSSLSVHVTTDGQSASLS